MIKPINFKKIKEVLSQDPNIAVAYILGSYARGKPHPGSDIDIGLVFKNPSVLKNYLETHVKYYLLLADYTESIQDQRELDLVFLQKSPLSLQFETVNEGKILYQASPKYEVEYKENVINRYFDYQPFAQEAYHDLRKAILHEA